MFCSAKRSRSCGFGVAVQHTQSLADPLHRVIEGQYVEIGDDRRHFQRHVVHIGARDACTNQLQPLIGLGVTQNRLTKHVDVQPKTIKPPLGDVIAKFRVIGREHNPVALAHDALAHQRHHDPRQWPRNDRSDAQHHAVQRAERSWHSEFADNPPKPRRCSTVRSEAQHFISQRKGQLAQTGVVHQRCQSRLLAPLDQADQQRWEWVTYALVLLGLAVELGLLVFIVFTAPGNWVFGTQAFEPGLWGIIVLLALAFGILEETRKYAVRRWARPQPVA